MTTTSGTSVLLVDDDEKILLMNQDILEMLGFRVKAVNRGQEALRFFEASPGEFDLLITDYFMPCMTGIELAKKIRKINKSIVIVLATGSKCDIHEKDVEEAKIADFLIKPFSIGDFKKTIEKALQSKSRVCGSLVFSM